MTFLGQQILKWLSLLIIGFISGYFISQQKDRKKVDVVQGFFLVGLVIVVLALFQI